MPVGVLCSGLCGSDGDDGVSVTTSLAGGGQCPHGGVVLHTSAADSVVCNSAPDEDGAQGPKGDTGTPGTSVTHVAATPAQCPHGGIRVTSGSVSVNVCNGAPGADGEDGDGRSVVVTDATTAACPHGGIIVRRDDGTDARKVCSGRNGTDGTSVTHEPASAGECPHGGTRFQSASGHSAVCNGAPAPPAEGSPLFAIVDHTPAGHSLAGGTPGTTIATEGEAVASFPAPVTGCAPIVTPWGSAGGMASARVEGTNAVRVFTFTSGGSPQNSDFYLAVMC